MQPGRETARPGIEKQQDSPGRPCWPRVKEETVYDVDADILRSLTTPTYESSLA